jgi:hypothetical protein
VLHSCLAVLMVTLREMTEASRERFSVGHSLISLLLSMTAWHCSIDSFQFVFLAFAALTHIVRTALLKKQFLDSNGLMIVRRAACALISYHDVGICFVGLLAAVAEGIESELISSGTVLQLPLHAVLRACLAGVPVFLCVCCVCAVWMCGCQCVCVPVCGCAHDAQIRVELFRLSCVSAVLTCFLH